MPEPESVALYISWSERDGGGTPSARGGAVGTGGITARRSGLLRVAGGAEPFATPGVKLLSEGALPVDPELSCCCVVAGAERPEVELDEPLSVVLRPDCVVPETLPGVGVVEEAEPEVVEEPDDEPVSDDESAEAWPVFAWEPDAAGAALLRVGSLV